MATDNGIEMRWIDAWDDVYEIAGDRWGVQCLLPSGQVVDADECRDWLQEQVYAGWFVKVEPGWVSGKQGIVASCWQ